MLLTALFFKTVRKKVDTSELSYITQALIVAVSEKFKMAKEQQPEKIIISPKIDALLWQAKYIRNQVTHAEVDLQSMSCFVLAITSQKQEYDKLLPLESGKLSPRISI